MNIHQLDVTVRLKQERDAARRWARAWKQAARKWQEEHNILYYVWKAAHMRAENSRRGLNETIGRNSALMQDRDQLAALVGALREACQSMIQFSDTCRYMELGIESEWQAYDDAVTSIKATLALTPPAALEELETRILSDKEDKYWADGDRWRQQVIEYIEIGGCPFCWANDGESHKEKCELAELEARVRGEEQERCCQSTCHYCLEHVQGKQVSAAYSSDRDEWAHEIYISRIDEPLIRYCRAQAIREGGTD